MSHLLDVWRAATWPNEIGDLLSGFRVRAVVQGTCTGRVLRRVEEKNASIRLEAMRMAALGLAKRPVAARPLPTPKRPRVDAVLPIVLGDEIQVVGV